MTPGNVSCGHCGGRHASPAEVRECFERRKALAARAMGSPVPAATKALFAGDMHSNSTVSEQMLRIALEKRLALSVEAQANVLGWIVDFYVPAARLVVEVDGGSHDGREPEDARRDEQMRAERYIVIRISASDVERDVDAAAEYVESQIPVPAYDEQRRLDEEAAVLLVEEARVRTVDRIRAQPPSRTPARVRAKSYSYVCVGCGHGFRSSEKPMPECRRCNSSREVRVACRCGAVALRGRYRCADCDAVFGAAGPAARAYTGQLPSHARRGKRL